MTALAAAAMLPWSGAEACGHQGISADGLTDEHVSKAIDAIVEELYRRRHPQHFWDPVPWGDAYGSKYQVGGYTALTVLALLSAGESYQDPRLRDAVTHLEQYSMEGTYAVATRAAVWAKLPPRFHKNLAADIQWLLDGFSRRVGGWDYRPRPNTTRRDNSIAQYGALALWEAARRGVEIDPQYWQQLEDGFLNCQLPDGGWNYTANDDPARGSMTAAGLATLFITQDLLHAEECVKLGSGVPPGTQSAIDRGLEWMRLNFTPLENPGKNIFYFFYLYSVERVGLAGGVKYFGEHDWFREGAAGVLRRLCRWDSATRTMSVHRTMGGDGRAADVRTHHLAFSLMFLSRGRVPVALNKLKIDGCAWNNRPRDAANLAAHLGEVTEGELNWQVVELHAQPEQWLDAPILYLASHEALPFVQNLKVNEKLYQREMRQHLRKTATGEPTEAEGTETQIPPEMRKLKDYIDLGGLVLAVSEGSSRAFARSVEKLGTLLYPRYDWRTLPPDHWAHTMHRPVNGRRTPLRGISNGVRELIILAPRGDWPAAFQVRDEDRPDAFDDASNIYFYASEFNRPRARLARHAYVGGAFTTARRTVTAVRAMHADNWNPEPQALPVFRSYLAGEHDIDLRLIDRPLRSIADLEPAPALVIVSGVDPHEFTGEERHAIRQYATSGTGMILFETTGGLGEFTLSAEQLADELFEKPIRSLLRHAIVTGRGMHGPTDLSSIEYRPYSREIFAARETTPRLRGMKIGDEVRLLFSREDICNGLLDQPCWGISGYKAASARRLLANVLQYVMARSEQK